MDGGDRADGPGAERRGPSLGAALGVCVVAVGVGIGLRPLYDNSFLTHLATGRLILERGAVPDADPYTFTAAGDPWVVQSWLASWLYATVESVAGLVGLRLLMGTVAGVLTAVAWRLTRPAGAVVGRLGLGALFLAVAGGLWGERPFMLGLLALAAVVLAAEGGLDPKWLVPVGWLWVNTHGSFPLGVVYLAVAALGQRLDGERPTVELRALSWLLPGIVAGAVSPVGPRLLTFPLELLQRQDVLRNVIEWQAPAFTSFSQRAFLLQIVVAVVLIARRPTYRGALVAAVFTAAALVGSRNITVASLVLLPAMASSLAGLGSLVSTDRGRLGRLVAAVGVGSFVLVGIVRLDQRDLDLRRYPVDAVAFVAGHGVDLADHHLAAPDIVGNYLELTYGPAGIVFYDDRFDMFPAEVSDAHLALVEASPSVRTQLADHDIDLVVWGRTGALAQVLAADPSWRTLFSDEEWMLTCRRGRELGGTLGRC